jgi:hypothetical protein
MSTLVEIEAAVDRLPPTQQRLLLDFLATRLEPSSTSGKVPSPARRSVLEIPALSVGEVLIPFSADDDLLGEMLEARV